MKDEYHPWSWKVYIPREEPPLPEHPEERDHPAVWLAPQPGLVGGVLLVAEEELQELRGPREGGLADTRLQMVSCSN